MNRAATGQDRGLYRWLDEPVTPEFEAGIDRWWKQNTEAPERSARRDAGGFCLQSDQIRPLFAEYIANMSRWTDRNAATWAH